MKNEQIRLSPEFFYVERNQNIYIFSVNDSAEELICLEESGPVLWKLLTTCSSLDEFYKRAGEEFQQPLTKEDEDSIHGFVQELIKLKIIEVN